MIGFSDPYQKLQYMIEHPESYATQGTHSVKLNFSAPALYAVGRTQAFRMKITVVSTCQVDEAVFVYSNMPDGSRRFENVASPNDLLEYPVNAPNDPQRPYYRLPYADLVFRNLDMCVDAAVGAANDVLELVRTLDGLDNLANLGDLTIGNCEQSSSSSSSSSA